MEEEGLGLFLVEMAAVVLYQDRAGQHMDPCLEDVAHEEGSDAEVEAVVHYVRVLDILSFGELPALDLDHVEAVGLGHVPALAHKDLKVEVVD